MQGFPCAARVFAQGDETPAPAEPAPGPCMVPILELLTPGFLSRHTQFPSFDDLVGASGLGVGVLVDADAERQQEWDHFIRQTSRFPDWATMVREARGEWVIRRMGIAIDT